MNMPGFTAEASLYKMRVFYQLESTVGFPGEGGTLRYSAVQMQAGRGTFGSGPRRNQLPDWFTCSGTSIDIDTCHSCFNTQVGRMCVCYDCDRGSGECTPGYMCTDIYGLRRPPTFFPGAGLGSARVFSL